MFRRELNQGVTRPIQTLGGTDTLTLDQDTPLFTNCSLAHDFILCQETRDSAGQFAGLAALHRFPCLTGLGRNHYHFLPFPFFFLLPPPPEFGAAAGAAGFASTFSDSSTAPPCVLSSPPRLPFFLPFGGR